MAESGHILVINPGSTSTKLGLYTFNLDTKSLLLDQELQLDHSSDNLPPGPVIKQLSLRSKAIAGFLKRSEITPDIIMARGAPLHPLEGGVYAVNKDMLGDIKSTRYADHASNLAALIGNEIANGAPVYIADPITTDEFEEIARISGLPEIERKSRSHALNIKAVTREICKRLNHNYEKSRWVVCHMGGGISIAALKNTRIIDVNDALLGMGPFSPERAGALPLSALLDLAYSQDKNDLLSTLSKNSGLKAYLGTADLQEVEHRIKTGDRKARLVFEAMAYQISKEIAAMASVLQFDIQGIILTGGMAHSKQLCAIIEARVHRIAPIHIEAGEHELDALANAGFRVLRGIEDIKTYHSVYSEN